MSFNSNNRTLRRWGCINDSSKENLSVRCNNNNYKVTDIHSNLRLCTRCSRYFCSECCVLDQQIICLLNICIDNYWFCPNCTKPALNIVFVEKDIEERCAVFLESISERVTVLEENSQAHSSNLKALETSIERNNLNINSCLSNFENLKERVDFLKKTNTEQVPPTINPSNIESANSPTLINQLEDWQLLQNNLIIYDIPETELVNQQDIKTGLLSKFKELITDNCNVTIETKDIVSINLLGSKSDTDPKNRPIFVKFVNTSLKLKLIKKTFHLKNTGYSVSFDRTIKECNSYKALLNQKKKLKKEEMLALLGITEL